MDYFRELAIAEPLKLAIRSAGFRLPTPIQTLAIPPALEGRDLLGCAQTGSGKTLAFAVPLLQRLAEHPTGRCSGAPRALILAPTRELAAQIGETFSSLGRGLGLRHTVIYGGVGKQSQISILKKGVDILVATPGRLLDLMGEGRVSLSRIEAVVFDEADRMLDMGFLPDVRRIAAALSAQRQSLFFSATLPPDVVRLAKVMLRDPLHIEIPPSTENTPRIDQKLLFVAREDKKAALCDLLARAKVIRALVFTRTKHRARSIARFLAREGFSSDSLHGDKSQAARQKALAGFHSGRIKILVATDIASRGLDVDDIDYIINYELPHEPEVYVHRIGRTARAGKQGVAFSFCDLSELSQLTAIERVIKSRLPVETDHRHHSSEAASRRLPVEAKKRNRHSGGNRKSASDLATGQARRTRAKRRRGNQGRFRSVMARNTSPA